MKAVSVAILCLSVLTVVSDAYAKPKYKKCPKYIGTISNGTYLPSKGNYVCFSSEKNAQGLGYLPAGSPGTGGGSPQPPAPPPPPPPPANAPFDISGQGGTPSREYRFVLPVTSILFTAYLDPTTCPANKSFPVAYQGDYGSLQNYDIRTPTWTLVPGAANASQIVAGESFIGSYESVLVVPGSALASYPGCKWVVNIVPGY